MVGLALGAYTVSAESPGPQAEAVSLTGTMPGKPPTIGATITSPKDGTHFSTSPVEFSGTCPDDTIIELYKNDIFAGSTECTEAGIFKISIDLMVGTNSVIAVDYDALNQAGPNSNTVTVYYDALPAQSDPLTSVDLKGAQLILNTDAVFRGTFPNQALNLPLTIIGGTPPYAVNIQWGDSNNKIISRNNNAIFTTPHIYTKAGTYQISIQATDSTGRVAFLTVAAIVNGQPSVSTTTNTTSTTTTNKLLVLWPLYVSAIAVMISFWIGERREKAILAKHGRLLPS